MCFPSKIWNWIEGQKEEQLWYIKRFYFQTCQKISSMNLNKSPTSAKLQLFHLWNGAGRDTIYLTWSWESKEIMDMRLFSNFKAWCTYKLEELSPLQELDSRGTNVGGQWGLSGPLRWNLWAICLCWFLNKF